MAAPARAPHLATLILLSALAILPIGIFLPSTAGIAQTFGVDYGLISIALSGYAAMSAGLQLVMGPMSDRFGRRPVILAGLLIFIVASVGTALATSVWTFLGFRMLQAVVATGYVIAMAVIRDTTSREMAASRIGYVAMAWSLAPMLGPSLGGLLDETFGWRSVFWLLAVAGVLVLLLAWFDLGETIPRRSATVMHQIRTYPVLLRARRFWAHALCMTFSAGAFYAFLAGAPLAAQSAFAMTPAMIGLGLGTITGGFMIGAFLSGRYARRKRPIVMMMSGRITGCAGLLIGLALALLGVAHPASLFAPCILVGIGNGLTVPSANAGAISIHPGLVGSAAGLAAAIAVAGGASIAALTGAILTPHNARIGLLLIMLASTLLSLAATFWIRRLDRQSGIAAAG